MKRQLKGGGKSMEKNQLKVVKAIAISSLIYGLLKCQRAFLSATFYFYSNRLTANGTEAIMRNQKDYPFLPTKNKPSEAKGYL